MEQADDLRQQVRRERHIKERCRLAATHLAAAHLERTWASASAHQHGRSIRQIAMATGLCAPRVHQLLTAADPQAIPRWLSRVREQDRSPPDAPATPADLGPDRQFGRRRAPDVVALR